MSTDGTDRGKGRRSATGGRVLRPSCTPYLPLRRSLPLSPCPSAFICGFLLLLPGPALAWHQATTADPPYRPLFIDDSNCVMYTIQEDCSADVPVDRCRAAVTAGMDVWTAVDGSYFAFVPTGPASCCRPGYQSAGGNANCVFWREDEWPADYDPLAIALTTITYEKETGRILDADVEFNGAGNTFGVDCEADRSDIANTMAHEAGHLLGLDHSDDPTATMWRSSHPGDCQKRDLAADDIEGVRALYPSASDPGVCLEPAGGLNLHCAPPPDDCGCRAAGASASRSALPLLAAGALLFRGCRRSRRR